MDTDPDLADSRDEQIKLFSAQTDMPLAQKTMGGSSLSASIRVNTCLSMVKIFSEKK